MLVHMAVCCRSVQICINGRACNSRRSKLAYFFPSSLLRVVWHFKKLFHFFHGCLSFANREPFATVLFVQSLTSSVHFCVVFVLCFPPINSFFQYFGTQVSGSIHMAKVLELAPLGSCELTIMRLHFFQHCRIGPMCALNNFLLVIASRFPPCPPLTFSISRSTLCMIVNNVYRARNYRYARSYMLIRL